MLLYTEWITLYILNKNWDTEWILFAYWINTECNFCILADFFKHYNTGLCWTINRTIKEELKGAFERIGDLVLVEELKIILDDYNNWKHFSTGKKPNDLFNFIHGKNLREAREYRNQNLTVNFKSKEKHLNLKEAALSLLDMI